jgi:hypothetical protein
MKLYIGTPARDLSVHAAYHFSVIHAMRQPFASWNLPTKQYDGDIVRVRSRIVRDMLESDADALLFWDADIDAHPGVFAAMVSAASTGADFVSTRYRKKKTEIDFVIGGVGLSLLSRTMLETMVDHYREELWATDDDGREVVQLFHLSFGNQQQTTPRKRLYLSEDYSFRQRWIRIGGVVHDLAHPMVGHHGANRFGSDV